MHLRGVIDRIEATVAARADEFRAMLRDAGFLVHDEGVRQCGIVTTTTGAPNGPSAQDLWETLTLHRINSSTTMEGSSRYDVEHRQPAADAASVGALHDDNRRTRRNRRDPRRLIAREHCAPEVVHENVGRTLAGWE